MNQIIPMGDHYAVLNPSGVMIGTVEKTNETQWGWYPFCDDTDEHKHLLLMYALKVALKWKG